LFEAPARRFSDADLEQLARGERVPPKRETTGAQVAFARKRLRFLIDEGVLAIIEPSRGTSGELFVQQGGGLDAHRRPTPPAATAAPGDPAQIVVAAEHYGRMARLLSAGQPIAVELDIRNRFLENQPGVSGTSRRWCPSPSRRSSSPVSSWSSPRATSPAATRTAA
jgi:hypothetical protein